jgi:hypothetical protein
MVFMEVTDTIPMVIQRVVKIARILFAEMDWNAIRVPSVRLRNILLMGFDSLGLTHRV